MTDKKHSLCMGWREEHVRVTLIFRESSFHASLYWPKPWTKYCPQFACKMGTYISRNVSLTTEFARTYSCRQYQNHVRSPKWREIQKSPKTPRMGFLMGSHHDASLCRHRVHHIHVHTNAIKLNMALLS